MPGTHIDFPSDVIKQLKKRPPNNNWMRTINLFTQIEMYMFINISQLFFLFPFPNGNENNNNKNKFL